jgi:RimJ/RimL family protein N-acetyltransferase
MSFLFYRHDGDAPVEAAPCDAEPRWWYPGVDGFPVHGPPRNLAWWGLSRAGMLAGDRFAELSLCRGGRVVHRLIVTPRWHRFPFMREGDLQIGDLRTYPDARRQGLARHAIAEAHRAFATPGTRFWYVVATDNRASVRLIESCGYRLVGEGRRTVPLGVHAIGRYVLDHASAAGDPHRRDRA